jgi:glycosyltransferase involved in cell wall biosynthesis
MKILHVIPSMHPSGGGPPVVVDRVCRELAGLGIETRILTTDLHADGPPRTWKDEWSCADRIEVCSARGRSPFAFSPELSRRLTREAGNHDLVHLHTLWSHASWSVRRAFRQQGRPYLVMPHGMLDPHSIGRKRFKKQVYGQFLEFPMLRAAAGIICTHAEEARLANQTCRGLPDCFVTPLGADEPPDDRETLRGEFLARHPGLRERELVLFLSRLHEKKGLDLLLPAFRLLHQNRPSARLLLVGAGEAAYERQLRQRIQSLGLGELVTLTGNLGGRDKWRAMAASALFALTSYQENFSLVTTDAMRIGLPVVLSRRVNLWNDVVSAGAGLACDLDPEEIASKLEQVLQDPARSQTMGRAGQRLVDREFSWRRCAERTAETYRTIATPRDNT